MSVGGVLIHGASLTLRMEVGALEQGGWRLGQHVGWDLGARQSTDLLLHWYTRCVRTSISRTDDNV